jgi:hypothetical protein
MGAIGRGEGIAVIAVAAFEPAAGRDRESGSE